MLLSPEAQRKPERPPRIYRVRQPSRKSSRRIYGKAKRIPDRRRNLMQWRDNVREVIGQAERAGDDERAELLRASLETIMVEIKADIRKGGA